MSNTLRVVKKFFPNVTKVVDAKMSAAIEVTPADAASKAIKKHNECALAVACKRKFHLDGVIISRSVAYLIKGKKARRFKLNDSVAREIVSFDRGAGFQPGKYELAAPSPSMLSGARVKKEDPMRDHKSKNVVKRFRHLTTNARFVLGGVQPE